MTTRRRFLKQVGAAAGLVTLGGAPPVFLSRAAHAAKDQAADADGRVLVLIELAGGNDGLNTVVPFTDDAYYKARPGIGFSKETLHKIDDGLGLHPAMTGFKALYDDGRLAVVQGVGYPNPNRSHFRSMDVWQSARPDVEYTRDGWLGRALDQSADSEAGRVRALALGTERLPLAMVARRTTVPTVRDLNAYRLNPGPGSKENHKRLQTLLSEAATTPAPAGSDLDFLRRTTRTAVTSAKRLEDVRSKYKPAAEYPNSALANKLKLAAQIIAGDLGTRIFYVSLGGFDTHADQAAAHQALLTELSSSVRAFHADLAGHKLADRVLIATFSEFGRRVKENGSLGTDHGAASQMFVVTPRDKGGVKGRHPSLTDLDQGDLKYHTDFRAVYGTILDGWLGWDAGAALGAEFPRVDVV